MKDLLILLGISLVLAYCSERSLLTYRITKRCRVDIPLIVMVIMLSMYCGLRTAFNDTEVYIKGFQTAPTLAEFWAEDPHILGNPLYYGFQSFFRHYISDNYHLFLLLIAFYSVTSFVIFIRKYSENFVFSILLFFALGLYVSNFASMKQCIAMATLTYAIPKLLEKKYVQYYIIVLVATLWHSYALMFAILPIFTRKPWTTVTYLTIAAVIAVLLTFETTISEFLEYAEDLGKDISETEVFETDGINVFRLAVFGVPPLLSFIFQSRLKRGMVRDENVMVNMSILSFLIMCLGLASAGNLFGRSAIYFEIGTIVILPWIVRKLFTKKSAELVFGIAALSYIAFFMYDIRNFSSGYRAITFMEFIMTLY